MQRSESPSNGSYSGLLPCSDFCINYLRTFKTHSSITFHWKTHLPPGLSQKDIQMADFCEFWADVVKIVPAENAPSCLKPKAAKA